MPLVSPIIHIMCRNTSIGIYGVAVPYLYAYISNYIGPCYSVVIAKRILCNTDYVRVAILCHLPQYEYGSWVPKPGHEAKPSTRVVDPGIRTNTGAGDTVLAKHT